MCNIFKSSTYRNVVPFSPVEVPFPDGEVVFVVSFSGVDESSVLVEQAIKESIAVINKNNINLCFFIENLRNLRNLYSKDFTNYNNFSQTNSLSSFFNLNWFAIIFPQL